MRLLYIHRVYKIFCSDLPLGLRCAYFSRISALLLFIKVLIVKKCVYSNNYFPRHYVDKSMVLCLHKLVYDTDALCCIPTSIPGPFRSLKPSIGEREAANTLPWDRGWLYTETSLGGCVTHLVVRKVILSCAVCAIRNANFHRQFSPFLNNFSTSLF